MAKELLDGDIHSKNAELIGKDRNTAKVFFYSLLYGVGITKLAQDTLKCNIKEAKKIMDSFYDGNPGLKKLKEYLERYYKKHKHIVGIDGRPLYIRSNHVLLNSLIQGGAAIIFKKWSTLVWREIDRLELDAEVIIMYHDELQIRCHEKDTGRLKVVLRETLDQVALYYKLKVPLATDSATGSNWSITH